MMDGSVPPYTKLLLKKSFELLPTQAPIRELKTREVEEKKVAADMVLEITLRHGPLSLASTCSKYPLKLLMWKKVNHVELRNAIFQWREVPATFSQPKLFCSGSHSQWLWSQEILSIYREGKDGNLTWSIIHLGPRLHLSIPSSKPFFLSLASILMVE